MEEFLSQENYHGMYQMVKLKKKQKQCIYSDKWWSTETCDFILQF